MDKLYFIESVKDAVKFVQYLVSLRLSYFHFNGGTYLIVPGLFVENVLSAFKSCGVVFMEVSFIKV